MDPINRRQFVAGALATALAPASLESAPVPRAPGTAPALPPRFEEPPLPAGVYQRVGSARFRIPLLNSYLSLTPNGKHVVTGTPDEIKVWEFATGRCVATHLHSEHYLMSVGDGHLIYWHQDPKKFNLHWVDLLNGRTIKPREKHVISANASIDPNGRRYLTSSEYVECFDCATGNRLWTKEYKAPDPESFIFSGDGSRVAILFDGKLAIVDASNGYHINGFQIRTADQADGVVLSHTGKIIVDWSKDGTGLRVHEVTTAKCIWKRDFEGGIRAVQVLPEDSALIIAVGKQLNLCDLQTGKELRRFAVSTDDKIVISRDSKFAVVVNSDYALEFIDLRTGDRLLQTPDPAGRIEHVQFLSNKHVVGRSETFQMVWDLANRSSRRVDATFGDSSSIAIAPDGGRHAIAVPTGVQIFEPAKSGKAREIALADIRGLGWADSGNLIAWTGETFHFFDLARGSSKTFTTADRDQREHPTEICVSGDRKTVLLISIVIVGIGNGAYPGYTVARLDRATGQITNLKLGKLPDWRHFSASIDLRLIGATEFLLDREWGVVIRSGVTGATIRTITEIVSESPSSLAPDGRMVAVVRKIYVPQEKPNQEVEKDEDGHVPERPFTEELQLIEFGTWKIRRRFPPMSMPKSIAFSPDGRTLATSHDEAPVYLWDIYGERTNPLPKPDAAALRAAWVELASADAEVAFRAICQLVQHPKEALPILAKNLKPAEVPDQNRVRKAIEVLADRDYRTREAAERELASIVNQVRSQLQAAHDAGTHGPEANLRLERLLHRATLATPQMIRAIRAHEALERIGTPAAKAIVEASAKGAPEAEQTVDAAATLGRWTLGV